MKNKINQQPTSSNSSQPTPSSLLANSSFLSQLAPNLFQFPNPDTEYSFDTRLGSSDRLGFYCLTLAEVYYLLCSLTRGGAHSQFPNP